MSRVRWAFRPLLAALATALATGACEGEEPQGTGRSPSGEDAGSSPARVVVNGPPAAPRWIIEPEVWIGRVEGDGPDTFGQIKGIAPLPDGRIAVLDAQAQEIRLFAPTGEHVGTLGARGQGPGELGAANGILVGPDGIIRAHDPLGARLSLFDPDAGLLATRRLEINSWGFLWNAVVDGDGNVYEFGTGERQGEMWGAIRTYDAEGEWRDTVWVARAESFTDAEGRGRDSPMSWHYDLGRIQGFIAVPFLPRSTMAIDPRGFFWGKGVGANDYRFVQTTFTYDTLLVVEGRRAPLSVTAAERDSVVASIRDRLGGLQLDWSRIPDEKPIVETIFLDDGGRVWVRVLASPSETTFDVFGRDGAYQGTAVTELRIPSWWTPAIVGDRFYTLHTDDLEVPYVVRARIRPL